MSYIDRVAKATTITELHDICDEIVDLSPELATDLRDNFDNDDALARGPITYLNSVKINMINTLDDAGVM